MYSTHLSKVYRNTVLYVLEMTLMTFIKSARVTKLSAVLYDTTVQYDCVCLDENSLIMIARLLVCLLSTWRKQLNHRAYSNVPNTDYNNRLGSYTPCGICLDLVDSQNINACRELVQGILGG
jgi:hypothetical protein